MDELCKEHDIAYERHKDSLERAKADEKLKAGAAKRIFAKDASFGERAASALVTAAMKVKGGLSKYGMGLSKRKPKKKIISFNALVQSAKRGMKKSNSQNFDVAAYHALRSAKKYGKGKHVRAPRVIQVPSITGGVLPLLPILAGLGAIGSIIGSATGIVKTVKDIKNAKAQLEENKRHNLAMERKIGSGLYFGKMNRGFYLRRKSRGGGLYLKPFSKLIWSKNWQ